MKTDLFSFLPGLLFSLILLAVSVVAAPAEDLVWHKPAEFDLEGRGWTDTEAPFDRLPARAKGKAPEEVWHLSKHSAGECVRFQTDAREIGVRWSLTGANLAMPHMPATGVSGVDLYRRTAEGGWRFVQNGRPHAQENTASFPTGSPSGRMQEYLLYLPLYNGTRSLEIGIPAGAHIQKAAPRPEARRRPIVFYGTSITQGGCASRPGMAYVAILGRRLDWPVINLGFSGSGKMEPEMAALVAELDPALFVLDCVGNMSVLPEEEITRRVVNLARAVRQAHPHTPMLFVGQSSIRRPSQFLTADRAQERAIKQLLKEGMTGITLRAAKNFLGTDEEGTVDGVHPNDLGMIRQADALTPTLRDILTKAASPSTPR